MIEWIENEEHHYSTDSNEEIPRWTLLAVLVLIILFLGGPAIWNRIFLDFR